MRLVEELRESEKRRDRAYYCNDNEATADAKKGVQGVTYKMLSAAQAAPFNAATDRSIEDFLNLQEKKGVPARAIYAALTK